MATSATTVSAALVRLGKDGKQKPIFFVSKVLTDIETRYTDFEIIALALRTTTKKLCSYFQAHTIVVLISYPIRAILHKPDVSRWLLKWAVELNEFDIEHRPRLAIKGQILVDFIAKMLDVQPCDLYGMTWLLETDGSSKAVGGRVGMVLQSSKAEGLSVAQAVKFVFPSSNYKAEYEVVLLRLRLAKELSITNLELRCDSQLVAS